MGLFSKKKEETSMLPDLPESNAELPSLPDYNQNNASLNSDIPVTNFGMGSPVNENQQNAIKNEIHSNMGVVPEGGLQKSQFEPLPHYDNAGMPARIVAEPGPMVEEHDSHEGSHEPRTFEMGDKTPVQKSVRGTKPIYIRLDKFKAGLESFEDIKNKITEIEDLLVKIRDMKDKEEKELEEWEREIQVVKARIEQIDNDVFTNVE